MRKVILIISLALVFGCVKDESVPIEFENITLLANDLEGNTYQKTSIFAFAANGPLDNSDINIYTIIENDASDIKFYSTGHPNIDSENFYNYRLMEVQPRLISEGKITQFKHAFLRDEWIIVSYKIDSKIKLSSPIRINNLFQRTEYLESVAINQDENGNPRFNWDVLSYDENAFFFEIMKNNANDVLSLTFTNESNFQYFNLSNVTLNLSDEQPPNLILGEDYEFMVLDISLDNWINTLYLSNFIVE